MNRYLRPDPASRRLPANGLPPIVHPSSGQHFSSDAFLIADAPAGAGGTSAWIDLGEAGPSGERPACRPEDIGRKFIDTEIDNGVGVLIAWDGATWRRLNGEAA